MVKRSDRPRWSDILDRPTIPTPGEAGDTAALEAGLAAETAARKSADAVLAGKVTEEAAARSAFDVVLQATKQPLDSDLTAIAALSTTAYGRSLLELANQAALVALLPAYQPSDSDLTAIAALTTTSFGRSLLELANATALRNAAVLGATDTVQFGATTVSQLTFSDTVWDDIRITPSGFDFVGVNDPTLVDYQPGGSGATIKLWEFAKDDEGFATIQLPHGYKTNGQINAHVHWTPRNYGVAQRGNTVGWKIDYSLADINGAFAAMSSVDLSDAVPSDGVDHQHLMTPGVQLTVPTGFHGSGMILVRIYRSDTGTDDTWSETLSGRLPLLLEVDFHFEMDKVGSNDIAP
jgi:hypothetical protein